MNMFSRSKKEVVHIDCGSLDLQVDLGLERLLRDGKAGWVMGPSNEVLQQFVGKTALHGMDYIDYWYEYFNGLY